MGKLTLVTGGTGFIGSHLVEALVDRGERVRCLVRKKSNIAHLKSLGVELVCGDLLDKESLKKAVKNVSIVYHLAAKVRPAKIIEKVRKISNMYLSINVRGTINLIEACSPDSIRRFIYFSSIAAAGPGTGLTEAFSPCPITDYGKSKFEAEKYILAVFNAKKFPVIILRPGTIYGPRGFAILILSAFIKKGFLPIVGDGYNSVPMCYIDDLVKATLLAEKKAKNGNVYFIVERSYTQRELGGCIAKALGKHFYSIPIPKTVIYKGAVIKQTLEQMIGFQFSPFCIDVSKGAIVSASTQWVCSNEKAKSELGFMPTVNLEEGIKKTVDYFRSSKIS